MKNVSGNASSWLTESQSNVTEIDAYEVDESSKTVLDEINPLINELCNIKTKLMCIYFKYRKKELSDALVNIQSSLNSLKQIA